MTVARLLACAAERHVVQHGDVVADHRRLADDDAVRMIAFAIARDDLRGPLNAVAPEPVRNATFARQLAGALGRPCLFALPAPLIRAGLGEMGQELLLNSRRVLPMRMEQAGFRFLAPTLAEALARSLGRERLRAA